MMSDKQEGLRAGAGSAPALFLNKGMQIAKLMFDFL
jgi:hypothetical protein